VFAKPGRIETKFFGQDGEFDLLVDGEIEDGVAELGPRRICHLSTPEAQTIAQTSAGREVGQKA
jgi:hypothetical protein